MAFSKVSKETIIKALQAKQGFVTEAAKMLNISFQALYDRIKRTPEINQAWTAIKENHLDFAESKLLMAIKDGESWAICFYLKCQGKHRGYVERQEYAGADGEPININITRKKIEG
jgi:hypothetical protein